MKKVDRNDLPENLRRAIENRKAKKQGKSNAPAKVDPSKPMSRREWERYNKLKKEVVDAVEASFYKVGKALEEISRDLLYREEYRTFEQCCQKLFDIGRHRAYQLINTAGTYEKLLTIGQQTKEGESDIFIDVLPVNERQIRPLLQVPEKDRPLVWAKATETARDGKPSSGHVNKMVKAYLGEAAESKIKNTQARVETSRQMGAEIKGIFEQLLDEIRKIRSEGYKVTSRIALVNALEAVRRLISEDGDNIPENKINLTNREKLLRDGYTFLRCNRQKLVIEYEDKTAIGWQVVDRYESPEQMDIRFSSLLKNNEKYLID